MLAYRVTVQDIYVLYTLIDSYTNFDKFWSSIKVSEVVLAQQVADPDETMSN